MIFKEIADRGFSFVLSESDTGPTGPLGTSSSRTEWWVTFYRPGRVTPVTDVPHGFLASPLAKFVTGANLDLGGTLRGLL